MEQRKGGLEAVEIGGVAFMRIHTKNDKGKGFHGIGTDSKCIGRKET